MDQEKKFRLTREKHMDHMVKVVPFIVLCYAVQSFVILRANPSSFSTVTLTTLGCLIALMIIGFVTYDLNHQVIFLDDKMTCHFFRSMHVIRYQDIYDIQVKNPEDSFSTLTLITLHGKFSFYFVDRGNEIKAWLEEKRFEGIQKVA